jgi:hypothetical protein
MFVHRQSLLQLLPPHDHWSSNTPHILPWAEWGPRYTRWFNCAENGYFVMTVSNGQWYIDYDTENAPYCYTVIDFNHIAFGHYQQGWEKKPRCIVRIQVFRKEARLLSRWSSLLTKFLIPRPMQESEASAWVLIVFSVISCWTNDNRVSARTRSLPKLPSW